MVLWCCYCQLCSIHVSTVPSGGTASGGTGGEFTNISVSQGAAGCDTAGAFDGALPPVIAPLNVVPLIMLLWYRWCCGTSGAVVPLVMMMM